MKKSPFSLAVAWARRRPLARTPLVATSSCCPLGRALARRSVDAPAAVAALMALQGASNADFNMRFSRSLVYYSSVYDTG